MSSDEKAESSSASEDMKRKFREALEKKNGNQRAGEAHLDGSSGVHGVHGPAGHKQCGRGGSGDIGGNGDQHRGPELPMVPRRPLDS